MSSSSRSKAQEHSLKGFFEPLVGLRDFLFHSDHLHLSCARLICYSSSRAHELVFCRIEIFELREWTYSQSSLLKDLRMMNSNQLNKFQLQNNKALS